MSNNYEINVTVNGSRCKIYSKDGKKFIEAKSGSNYEIEIKNNTGNRVLSVSSVDGLNTINGKSDDLNTSPGYVINAYNSLKVDGFRVDDNSVSKFKFTSKLDGYAASKNDGSEKNVGVIGIRIFNEKITQPEVKEIHHYYNHWNTYTYAQYPPLYPSPVYPTVIWGTSPTTLDMSFNAGNCNSNTDKLLSSNTTYNCCVNNTMIQEQLQELFNPKLSNNVVTRGFDISTGFGESKESKVVEVEFKRNSIIHSLDIYYASRESLIEMGIILTNEKQINFPEAFKETKYCTPPKNWNK